MVRNGNDAFVFFRGHHGQATCMIVEFEDDLVRIFIQFLDDLALDVLFACAAQDVGQPGPG